MEPIDRATFDRTKQRHGGYASWALWAEPTGATKLNIGDISVLDPDQNPSLLEILRNDVIMVGLNISRSFSEPFRNFHDPRREGQDYKIRYAFAGTPYWGAYMTDFVKDLPMLKSGDVMDYLKAHQTVERENAEKFLEELTDLGCDRPTILTFGNYAGDLVANPKNVPRDRYARRVPLRHYSDWRKSPEEYRKEVRQRLNLP